MISLIMPKSYKNKLAIKNTILAFTIASISIGVCKDNNYFLIYRLSFHDENATR